MKFPNNQKYEKVFFVHPSSEIVFAISNSWIGSKICFWPGGEGARLNAEGWICSGIINETFSMPFYSVSDVGLGIYSIHEQMEHHPDEVYEWNRYINNFRMKNLFLCIAKYLLEVLFASFRIISWKLSDFLVYLPELFRTMKHSKSSRFRSFA